MAIYKTKAYVDGNWVGPKYDTSVELALTIPKQEAAYVNGDEVRFTKLRPDLDGLGPTVRLDAPATDGLAVKYLVLNTFSAGNPLLKNISRFRSITGITQSNEAQYFTAGANPTGMFAFFDREDKCLGTAANTTTPPAGTVTTVNWPALPYVAAVIATAAAAGVVSVATANTNPLLTVKLGRKMWTEIDGNNIQRYYAYLTSGDGSDVRGTPGKV